jgi:septal ring factor EnvC (AmiA/AmiB activator)
VFAVTKSEFHTALAQLWNALEQLDQKEGHDMADLNTALSDLDQLLSDVEQEVANLKQQVQAGDQAAQQQVADTLEAKIAAARDALANAQSGGGTTGGTGTTGTTPTDPTAGGGAGTPVTGDPGAPVGTDPSQGQGA